MTAALPGATRSFSASGTISDLGVNFASLGGPFINNFQAINRLPDHNPSNAGQYGVNFKVNFPSLNHGTQIGFYFLNYTSKVPVVSAQTGTQAGLANGFGAVSAVGGAAQALAAGLPFNEAVAVGAAAGQQRAAQLGGNLSATTATQYATIGANTLLAGGNVAAQAQSLGTNEYGQTAGYFEEFPQDIKLLRRVLQHPDPADRHRAAGGDHLPPRHPVADTTTPSCCMPHSRPSSRASRSC